MQHWLHTKSIHVILYCYILCNSANRTLVHDSLTCACHDWVVCVTHTGSRKTASKSKAKAEGRNSHMSARQSIIIICDCSADVWEFLQGGKRKRMPESYVGDGSSDEDDVPRECVCVCKRERKWMCAGVCSRGSRRGMTTTVMRMMCLVSVRAWERGFAWVFERVCVCALGIGRAVGITVTMTRIM